MNQSTDARYRIEEFLGAGGTGQVYRAWDTVLERHVALKLLRLGSDRAQDEALREARAQAQVSHPNLNKVFDVGVQDGKPYVASELIEGGSLAEAPPSEPRDAARLVRDVARSVHAAHEQGLVHRDLKPHNVLLDAATGAPLVVDFGIATPAPEATDGDLERDHHASSGTAPYMAPEQIRGGPQARAPKVDVYALGAVLHELLAGRPPFSGDDPIAVRKQVLSEAPTPLGSSLPEDLVAITNRALAKDPAQRYGSAAALADDLDRFLEGRPVEAMPSSWGYRGSRFVARNRTAVVVGALVTVAALVAGALWLQQTLHQRTQTRLARDFGAQAERLGARLQLAFLAETDDLEPARAVARTEMEEIQRRASELGAVAEGPAATALGFATLRLGDFDEAARSFEAAWQSGYRDADVALGFAEATARQVAEAQRTLYYLSPTVQRLEVERLERDLIAPALERLRFGRSAIEDEASPRSDRAYLDLLEAFLEQEHDRVPELAEAALAAEPHRYEARVFTGAALRAGALQSDVGGDGDARREQLLASKGAFEEAARIGRSDPRVFLELCMTEEGLLYDAMRQSLDELEGAAPSCDRAIALNPTDAEPLIARAALLQRRGLARARRGVESETALNEARALLEQAIEAAPRSAKAHVLLATQHMYEGDTRSWHDTGDHVDHARQATVFADRGAELDPSSVWAPFVQGQTQRYLAYMLGDQGEDPSTAVAAARTHFERALELAPDVGRTWANLGTLLDWYAEQQSRVLGQDPTESTRAAIDALQRAAELDARNAIPHSMLGVAHMTAADHLQRSGRDPLEHVDGANAAFETALELRPNSLSTLNNLAEVWLVATEFELAEGGPTEAYARHREYVDRAAALDPDEFGCLVAKSDWTAARIASRRGEDPRPALDAGLSQVNEIIDRVGESRICLRDRARLLLELARLDMREQPDVALRAWRDGAASLDRWASINPNGYQLWYLRGAYALFGAEQAEALGTERPEQARDAVEAFERTLEHAPGHVPSLVGLRQASALLD